MHIHYALTKGRIFVHLKFATTEASESCMHMKLWIILPFSSFCATFDVIVVIFSTFDTDHQLSTLSLKLQLLEVELINF